MFILYTLIGFVVIMAWSFLLRRDKFEDFCVGFFACLFVLTWQLSQFFLNTYLPAQTCDHQLRAIDLFFGLDGFWIARAYRHWPWFQALGDFVYASLPLAFCVAWTFDRSRTMIRAVLLGAVLAFPIYGLVPAVGPGFVFKDWPNPSNVLLTVPPGAMRNCMPSMHLSWALMLAINSKKLVARVIFWSYAALTAAATIGTGQHYVIDLVAAVPFTLAVQYLAERVASERPQLVSVPVPNSEVREGD